MVSCESRSWFRIWDLRLSALVCPQDCRSARCQSSPPFKPQTEQPAALKRHGVVLSAAAAAAPSCTSVIRRANLRAAAVTDAGCYWLPVVMVTVSLCNWQQELKYQRVVLSSVSHTHFMSQQQEPVRLLGRLSTRRRSLTGSDHMFWTVNVTLQRFQF